MQRSAFPARIAFAVVLVSVGLAGCGKKEIGISLPELAPVTGVVTLDGQPLEGAIVSFEPDDLNVDRRESRGVTGSDGRYELYYIDDVKGAVLGTLRVRISKLGDDERPVVPDRYNSKTELSANVQPGDNSFDFSLKAR